ncbi:MAG: response regulator transcription factor [Spirochaetaceae bacterium]|nr:MAG: response regulator transcription factor [Spirochaetaceae bacterium]
MDVLVIDDESSVGTLLRFNLRQRGFQVDTAASAAEGYAKAQTKRFDLIILDVALPGVDGIEACSMLKNLDDYEETPVIMISSRSDSVTIDQARRAGAADYLVKPFTFEELLDRMEDQLSRPYFV